ncbi:MAG: glucose-6-phosphate dehydrogenase [Candidatus Sungbacteria bacterium]|nr:glucose-6-phosphate dehydrogenase [Candidatus Sungbacteria bacterium]
MHKAETKGSYNAPTILVIFGITGDLARKKLIPALFSLHRAGLLPSHFRVVGFSRRKLSAAAFGAYIKDVIAKHGKVTAAERDSFARLFSFASGYFEKERDYQKLHDMLDGIDRDWGMCSNKLFYCAVNPEFYKMIFKNLAAHMLTDSCGPDGGWTRVIVEKPFGHDLKTARELDEFLGRLFTEDQLYRIDHYLAKEMLQNILLFRFANNLFEKNWSNETIESISIRLWEKIGVEDRGSFYDGVGALRDVGQNHLLQMLALVTMERPADFQPHAIRARRAEVLRTLIVPGRTEVAHSTYRAQYGGYRTISGVLPKSDTETYFKIHAAFSHPRWRGVPIMLESGKRMGEQRKEIEVVFKHPLPCLCPPGSPMHYKDRVVFGLEPEEKITIHFWSKKPGFVIEMEERTFEFLLRDVGKKMQYVEEYQKLLLDCIAGDQTLFVGTDEIRSMWKFVDPIVRLWKAGPVPLKRYVPDMHEWCHDVLPPSGMNRPASVPTSSGLRRGAVGLIGLGKMGKNMALRLLEQRWEVIAFDAKQEAVAEMAAAGAQASESAADLVSKLPKHKVIWLMVPSLVPTKSGPGRGKPSISPVDEVLFGKNGLVKLLAKGDVVIDGGNLLYLDSMRRAKKLGTRGIHFLDAGVSGGPEGARTGACIMVGGERKIFQRHEELFRALSLPGGYAYVGPSGAGHFVKMVHNGIEYGMMQSLAEGFGILKKTPFKLDVSAIARLYNTGSVIESRLVGWLASAYEQYGPDLKNVSGSVDSTGEGEWTVQAAKKLKIPAPVIEDAFRFRLTSRKNPSYAGKILSALRNQFGGHSIRGRRHKA